MAITYLSDEPGKITYLDEEPEEVSPERKALAEEQKQARLAGKLGEMELAARKGVETGAQILSDIFPTRAIPKAAQAIGVQPIVPKEHVKQIREGVTAAIETVVPRAQVPVDAPNIISPELGKKINEGLTEFGDETLSSFTSPDQAALLASGAKAPEVVGRLFQLGSILSVPEATQSVKEAINSGDAKEITKAGAGLGMSLAIPAAIQKGLAPKPAAAVPPITGRMLDVPEGAIPKEIGPAGAKGGRLATAPPSELLTATPPKPPATPTDIAKQLGLSRGTETTTGWEFDIIDPKDGNPITFSVPKDSPPEVIQAKANEYLKSFEKSAPLGEQANPHDILPAFSPVGGEPIPAVKGANHQSIIDAQSMDWKIDNLAESGPDSPRRGFLYKGKFRSREWMRDELRKAGYDVSDRFTSEELDALQKATPEAKPPTIVGTSTEGALGAKATVETTTPEPPTAEVPRRFVWPGHESLVSKDVATGKWRVTEFSVSSDGSLKPLRHDIFDKYIDAVLDQSSNANRKEAPIAKPPEPAPAAPTPPTPPTPTAKEPWEMTAVEARRAFPTLSQDKWDAAVTAAWKDGRLSEDSAPVQSMMRSKPRDFGEIDSVLNGRMEPSAELLKRHPDLAKPTPAPAAEKKGELPAFSASDSIDSLRAPIREEVESKISSHANFPELKALVDRTLKSIYGKDAASKISKMTPEDYTQHTEMNAGSAKSKKIDALQKKILRESGISVSKQGAYRGNSIDWLKERQKRQPTPPPGTQGLAKPTEITQGVKGTISFESLDEPSGEWQPREHPYVISKSTIPGTKPWRMTVFGGPKDSPVAIGHIELDSPTVLPTRTLQVLAEQLGRYTRKYSISDYKISGENYFHKPTEPPLTGMGGAVPAEFKPTEQTATGIKNATVDQERIARGLPAAIQPLRRSFGEVWDRAMAMIDHDPGVTDALLNDLREKPRALTDVEDALILQRQVDLQNEYGKATRDLAQAFDDGRMDDVTREKLRVAGLSDQLLDVYNIGKKVGTETGRGLNARKMMANEDFSLAQMELAKRAANNGRPLTDAERAELKSLHDRIAATQKAYDDYRAATDVKLAQLEAARAIADIKAKAAPTIDKRILAYAEKIVSGWETEATSAAARLKEKLKPRLGITPEPLDPTIISDAAIWGRAKISRLALDAAKFTDHIVTEFGEGIRPYIDAVWKASNDLINKGLEKVPERVSRSVKKTDLAGAKASTVQIVADKVAKGKRDEVTWYVQKLARTFVENGITDRERLIDEVHSVLQKAIPDITRRQTMDAISG